MKASIPESIIDTNSSSRRSIVWYHGRGKGQREHLEFAKDTRTIIGTRISTGLKTVIATIKTCYFVKTLSHSVKDLPSWRLPLYLNLYIYTYFCNQWACITKIASKCWDLCRVSSRCCAELETKQTTYTIAYVSSVQHYVAKGKGMPTILCSVVKSSTIAGEKASIISQKTPANHHFSVSKGREQHIVIRLRWLRRQLR